MKVLIINPWEDTVGEMTSQYTAGVTYEMDEATAGRAAKAKATHDPAARAVVKMKPLKPSKVDVDNVAELKKVTAELVALKKVAESTDKASKELAEDVSRLNEDLSSAGKTFKKMEAQIADLTKERDDAKVALAKANKPQA